MMLAHHSGRVAHLPPTAHALVIGGSGAVGRCVVAQLAADQAISKITCINRREWALPALSIGEHKLHHVTCNIESEKELSAAVCLLADQSVSVAYCTLGTTRRLTFACCRRFSFAH
jgi:saccharopine dehydrogenase-like NADP-dependent oxidoreductase